MKFLLDTHALLWWLADDEQLEPQARERIADPGNEILVSIASLWEIVAKARVGKLRANFSEITDAVEQQGFSLLELGVPHLLTLVGLPMHHRDPFDHLLIAQTIAEDVTFISEDRNAARYPVRIATCSDKAHLPPGAR